MSNDPDETPASAEPEPEFDPSELASDGEDVVEGLEEELPDEA